MFYLLWGILGCVKVFMSRRKAQGHVMLSRQMITEKEFLLFEKMINTCYGFVKWLLDTKNRERLRGEA